MDTGRVARAEGGSVKVPIYARPAVITGAPAGRFLPAGRPLISNDGNVASEKAQPVVAMVYEWGGDESDE